MNHETRKYSWRCILEDNRKILLILTLCFRFFQIKIYIIVDRHFGNQQLKSNYNVTVISIPLTDLLKYAECHLQAETSRGKVDFITSLYILEHKKYIVLTSRKLEMFFFSSVFFGYLADVISFFSGKAQLSMIFCHIQKHTKSICC